MFVFSQGANNLALLNCLFLHLSMEHRDVDSDLPKPISKLLDSLCDHTDLVEPKEGSVGEPIQFVEFNQGYVSKATETSYVPDLVPGQFQLLEEIDDEALHLH